MNATATTDPPTVTVRYLVLGEEDDEIVMLAGHGIPDESTRAAIITAGFGRIFDDITFNGMTIPGTRMHELSRFETWATLFRGCRRHGWIPGWLRRALARTVTEVRARAYQLLWRFVWRGDPERQWERGQPRWLKLLGRAWFSFEDCSSCVVVDHHHSCGGCVWCNNTPEDKGKPPLLWFWDSPEDDPADSHAGKRGYQPVTVISMRG